MNLTRCALRSLFFVATIAGVGRTTLAQSSHPEQAFGFTKSPLGVYSSEQARLDWPTFENRGPWGDRAQIVNDDRDRGRVLRVAFPKGAVGPVQGGMQFGAKLPAADEYWLSYLIKFENGFDFRKGGKLPGLTSGGSKFTGGKSAATGEGWSARYMWKDQGKLTVYLYHADMQGEYGDGIAVGDAKLETDRWYRLTQHIRLNTGDDKNGLLEVWVDGERKLARNDIRYRLGDKGPIDSFYFSTFHGGNDATWAPQQDSFARFDDFASSRTRPKFIKP